MKQAVVYIETVSQSTHTDLCSKYIFYLKIS